MNSFQKGVFLVLVSALAFSFLPIFTTYAYKSGLSISTLLLIRFFSSSTLFFLYSIKNKENIKLDKKSLLSLFLLGAVGYNLQSRFYLSSLKYVSPSLAALFLYTYPVIVSILSFITEKEKISNKAILSMLLSFSGLFLVLGSSFESIDIRGIIFASAASFVYSLYIIAGNKAIKVASPIVASAYIAFFSALGTFVIGFASKDLNLNFSISSLFPIIGIVLISTVIAMMSFFKGMEILGPTKTSVISLMEAVFTVMLSSLILKEHLTPIQFIGGFAVLLGAYIIIKSHKS
jgi:drug/metabolite transporter (DMT)-like permease